VICWVANVAGFGAVPISGVWHVAPAAPQTVGRLPA
jgi:hypothetical protein